MLKIISSGVSDLGNFILKPFSENGKLVIAITAVAAMTIASYNYLFRSSAQEPRIEQFREARSTLATSQSETNKTETVAKKFFSEGLSFEVGDEGLLHDHSLNSIPGTCFEIGASLSVLENPGFAGNKMDDFSRKLSSVLNKVYSTDLGNQTVQHNGMEKILRQVFDEKLLKEIKPSSDQIGRCTDGKLDYNWYAGVGLSWVQKELNLTIDQITYTHENMLTKIRLMSAFGTVAREIIPVMKNSEKEQKILCEILEINNFDSIYERYESVANKLRHENFDNPKTRARFERPPIIEGVSVGLRPLQDASTLNLGFGSVYGPESFKGNLELWSKYQAEEKAKGGRQGITRENQPINDLSRPGNISEYGLKKMPQAFKNEKLLELLKEKSLVHGTGINRWQVNGSYARQTWANQLPSAGSHSGGTVDVLLALECLSKDSICGDEDTVLKAGLLIASFMNFGGYHSFNETFPIAQAYSRGEIFEVNASRRSADSLYVDFAKTVKRYSNDAMQKVNAFRRAYKASFSEAKLKAPSENQLIDKAPKGSSAVF